MKFIDAAKKRLFDFMSDMHQWETDTVNLYKDGGVEKHGVDASRTLSAIYSKYLTEKDRKYGRLPVPNARFPTEYNPLQETIDSVECVSSNKIIIETHWIHPVVPDFKVKYKYALVFENNEWWIDTKKKYSPVDNKWKNVIF
ncbi:NTF2 fold immunity protein [Escherichia albertii]|uniref:NTF2 fold immunity protein n=1 Tax=Escherichia albertii TaxID=208962 RepID=UPI0007443611|nr:NTF2 fold immunity protein [Escherichia albertii]EEW7499261.1 hypothetical protein [Escherichia albertii]EEX4920713.1 hypothetical protein [Escherichia albertii]EFJ2288934.1 hypothetical protein [Escherichia albertii]EFO0111954.1 hypothetical protein [Escherichia albertii]EGQ0034733.1 hypothetical protein [Escherichia albertii]